MRRKNIYTNPLLKVIIEKKNNDNKMISDLLKLLIFVDAMVLCDHIYIAERWFKKKKTPNLKGTLNISLHFIFQYKIEPTKTKINI